VTRGMRGEFSLDGTEGDVQHCGRKAEDTHIRHKRNSTTIGGRKSRPIY